eukprot:COSAG06_NODE_5623_length_3353_cov_5.747388_2_plen_135_part_00
MQPVLEPEPEPEPQPAPMLDPAMGQLRTLYTRIFATICKDAEVLTDDAYSDLDSVLEVLHLPPTLREYVTNLRAAGVAVPGDNGPITAEQYVKANTAHFENLSDDMQRLAATLLPCVSLALFRPLRSAAAPLQL